MVPIKRWLTPGRRDFIESLTGLGLGLSCSILLKVGQILKSLELFWDIFQAWFIKVYVIVVFIDKLYSPPISKAQDGGHRGNPLEQN